MIHDVSASNGLGTGTWKEKKEGLYVFCSPLVQKCSVNCNVGNIVSNDEITGYGAR